MLHTPIYRGAASEYCGPTAIAAVTGVSLRDVRETIYQARGSHFLKSNGDRMPIIGMANTDLIATMALLGWHAVEEMFNPVPIMATGYRGHGAPRLYPTLLQFAEAHGARGPFIVEVTGHYIAVSHGELCDTRFRIPADLKMAVTRRGMPGRWVRHWWRFAPAEAIA